MTDWINVKDALPNVNEEVIVGSKTTKRVTTGRYKGVFCSYQWETCTFMSDKEITHWLPIPEPPESEGDAE